MQSIDLDDLAATKSTLFTVKHSVTKRKVTQRMDTAVICRRIFILLLLLTCVAGTIFACLTSHKVQPFVSIAPTDPVDGKWSPWTQWSDCSIICSSNSTPYGLMTRQRFCHSPPPQNGGLSCAGNTSEISDCIQSPCPKPINGGWTPWSGWSACGSTCAEDNVIPIIIRERNCSQPAPQYGGEDCSNSRLERRFCSWLPICPVDGGWGPWIVAGSCESETKEPCSIGRQRLERHCNRPSPAGQTGRDCDGLADTVQPCWFLIGCPTGGPQTPLRVHMYSDGAGRLNVTWTAAPYGSAAEKYRLYSELRDKAGERLDLLVTEKKTGPSRVVDGEEYWLVLDVRHLLSARDGVRDLHTLVLRLAAVDFWGKESGMTEEQQSLVYEVDGRWTSWSTWSECSTRCYNQKGSIQRDRMCSRPPPSIKGQPCAGSSREKQECVGMEIQC